MAKKTEITASDAPLAVITRPRKDAEPLAAELRDRGYAVLVEPMLEIVPSGAALPPLDPYQGLAFTSANGARIFAKLSDVRDVPAYAVGVSTAATLRNAGFSDIRTGLGDAPALATFIARSVRSGERVLHLSGSEMAYDLEPLLRPASVAVDRIVLYEARAASDPSSALSKAMYACTVGSVLLFSARTARAFETMMTRHGLLGGVRAARAVCLSPAVARHLTLAWGNVDIAAEPTRDAVLALLPELNGVADG